MGCESPTPENWHWKITPEDVVKIKAVDRETINRVYFDNYNKFRSICFKRFPSYWEDALQEIYVILPYCNYTNLRTFFGSILRRLEISIYGRSVRYPLSLDKPLNDETSTTFGDIIGEEYDFFHEDEEQTLKVISILDNQKFLTDDQKDYLISIAFGCQQAKGLYRYAKNGFSLA